MSESPDRNKLWAWSAVVLLAIGAVLGFVWFTDGSLPPPTPSPSSERVEKPSLATPRPASVGGEFGEQVVSRDLADVASDSARPGVYGVLLDNVGQPLVGYQLRLDGASGELGSQTSFGFDRDGSWDSYSRVVNFWPPEGVKTGEAGEFAFPGAPAGDYELVTVPFSQVSRTVSLAENERLQLTFQLAANEVATTGRIMRSAELQDAMRLNLAVGDQWRWSGESDEGVFRVVMTSGAHVVGAMSPYTSVRPRHPCGSLQLHVPQGQPRFDWTVFLECTDLVVFARDERGMLPEGCEVTVRCLQEDPIAKNALTQPAASKGTRFPYLPPGDYEVSVAGERLAALPAQKFTVGPGNHREELHFVVPRATTVKLLVRDGKRRLQAIAAASMPVLRLGDRDYPYGKVTHRGKHYSGRVYGFQNHPPGRAVVISEDRLVAGLLHYLAFDPVPQQFVHALLDQPTELTLNVKRRALVDLRACESGGREQFSATIEVFAGDQKIASLEERFCQRFRSYMPPGTYRVVIDRGGERTESELVVARRDIRLRLRP